MRVLAGAFAGALAVAAQANPTGPTVVHGSAQFARPGANALHVTTSPNAIINWQGFSIGASDVTRFIQQSASSAVLNRVTGPDPSSILGQLLSNGRVFLINPHGIVFGEGAMVDTAGLVASTLNISDADFRAGRYRFDGGPDAGGIANQGLIKAGAGGVFLLAPNVENSGVIRTRGGDLVLAAGRSITLTSLDLDGVRVEVQAPEDEALNLGTLIAERGAAGVFAGSIRNVGTVEANAVTVGEDGVIRLVAQGDVTLEAGGRIAAEGPSGGEVHIESEQGTTWVSGEVSARASEGRGGRVRLLGERVGLAGARVDASGPTGGGEVLVGGDVGGRGPTPTAEAVYVSADSVVSADAAGDGDGGKVVVFAEGFANVQGRLSARGGANGGDGGFVETSGRESFVIAATPDTSAPRGEGGHWLIDPNDIEIVAGSGNVNIPSADPFESVGDSAQLGIDLIIAALSGGQSVTVETTESGANSEDGDITLSAALDIESTTGTNTLTLKAHNDININAEISDAAGGPELDLELDAGNDVDINADLTLRGGSLVTNGLGEGADGRSDVNISNGAVVTIDGITWKMNAPDLDIANFNQGGDSSGTVIVENGGTIDATGNRIVVGDDGVGTLIIRSRAGVTAARVHVGEEVVSDGTVTVTGSGSTLTTTGTDNRIEVGDEGTGVLEVLDGGLVETHHFRVGHFGVGRATISGVASDGTRSSVIVSPDNGGFSGDSADAGGFVQVARNDGSRGTLQILDGALIRVRDGGGTFGPEFQSARNVGSVGTLLIDGAGSSLEVIQTAPANDDNRLISPGPGAQLGRRGAGTTTIRNGGRLLVRGERAVVIVSVDSVNPDFPDPNTGPIRQRSVVNILSGGRMEIEGEGAYLGIGTAGPASDGVVTVSGAGSAITLTGTDNSGIDVGGAGTGELRVESGAEVTARRVTVGDDEGSDGTVTVTGSGSTLTTTGTDNRIEVGDEGTGVLEVLDGGLVETHHFRVGYFGVGRATISGVASDGTRSSVIVSPDNGGFSGDLADAGGFVQVARSDGSRGTLELLNGGLLRVRDGGGTFGPHFQSARNVGSVGTLLIDGAGSSLEVIQTAPANDDNRLISPGPVALLGRRGAGTTTIRNGGRLLVRGERAVVIVSRDRVNPDFPDPDTGPIRQRSVVNILSGGGMEIEGEGEWAYLGIGTSGPASDGVVTVSGEDCTLTVSDDGRGIIVGDEGAGALTIGSGGSVTAPRVIVGRKPGSRGVLRVDAGGSLDAGALLAVGKDFDFGSLTTRDPGGRGRFVEEAGSLVLYDELVFGATDEDVQESAGVNTDAILTVQEDRSEPIDEGEPQARASEEDGPGAEGEEDEDSDEDPDEDEGEPGEAGEGGEEEREEIPMCTA